MAKLTRKLLREFASAAGAGEIDVFGSLAAGSLATSTDPDDIQSLSQWVDGWAAEVLANDSPVLEDRNAVDFVFSYMLKSIFQMGVPEYLATETYFIGSIVNSAGILYVSLTNTNTGNALTDTTNWRPFARGTTGTFASPTSVGGATAVPSSGAGDNDTYVIGATTAWVQRTPVAHRSFTDIAWSPELNLFVAINADAGDPFSKSSDGITWTDTGAVAAGQWQSICWAPQLGLFVGLASTGSNRAITSPDGQTWTLHQVTDGSTDQNSFKSICWSPELGLFVGVSFDGTNRVITSPDGVTWTARSAAAANQWFGVTWSPQLRLFVAVAITGTNRVMVSSNGIDWRSASASSAFQWAGVCWSAPLGLFCAWGFDSGGSTGAIMTSPDGINWTTRVVSSAQVINKVIWIDDFGCFVAARVGGTAATAFMVSSDGITWETYASTVAKTFTSIAYAPSIFTICAIGADGSNDELATFVASNITAASRIAAGTLQGQRKVLIGASTLAVPRLANGNGIQTRKTIYVQKNQRTEFIWDNARTLWLAP